MRRYGVQLIFACSVLLVLTTTYFISYQPLTQRTQQIQQSNRTKAARLHELELNRHIEDLDREITTLTDALTVFQAKMPQEKELEILLGEIWRLATKNNLLPDDIRTGDVMHNPRYSELPIEMKLAGPFQGLYQFLLDMEKLDRIARIHEMRLNKQSIGSRRTASETHAVDRDNNPMITIRLTLSVFFEAAQKDSAKHE